MPNRVGSSAVKRINSMDRRGLKPLALQSADRFQTAEHADRTVEAAGVGDGVDMRAGGDGREGIVGPPPAREGVADGIFANRQTRGQRQVPSRTRGRADRRG